MLKIFIIALILTSERLFVKTVIGVGLSREKITAIKITGEEVRRSINENADPCINYLDYICGNLNKTGAFSFSETILNRLYDTSTIEEVLKKYMPKSNLINAEVKLKNFLRSCKYNDTKNAKDILKNVDFFHSIRTWPAFDDNWNIKEFDFVMLLAELRSLLFTLGIDVGFTKRENKRIILISPEIIDRNFESKRIWRKSILEKFNIEKAEEIRRDVEKFEREFTSSVVLSQSEVRVETNYRMLKRKISQIDWDKYFQIAAGTAPDDSYPVIIDNLRGVEIAIDTLRRMEPKIVANYIFYKFMHRTYQMVFYTEIDCYDYAFLGFQTIITRFLANNFYSGEFNMRFFSVMNNLIEILSENLNIFQSPSKDIIANLEEIFYKKILPSLTDEYLNRTYINLKIDPRDYWGNIHRLSRAFIKQKLSNHLKEKEIPMEIVNQQFISYVMARSLYKFNEKPTALLFDSIAAPVIAEAANWLRSPTVWEKLKDTLPKCHLNQLNIFRANFINPEVVLIQGSQLYMDAYKRWVKKYKKIIRKEDDIFEVFELNSRKVLFTKLNDICPYIYDKDDYRSNFILEYLKHSEDFVKEYNCPESSSFNKVNTC